MSKTRKQFPFVKKSVKQDSICNICEQQKKLSVDHVPPKGCPPAKSRVTSKLLYQALGHTGFRPRPDQNGVTFKTVCSDCNSLLGSKYDRPLADLSKQIEKFVGTNLSLPKRFDVECRPNAIARSVLGHLLAAKTETDQVRVDEIIRPCVLDHTINIPDSIHVFYWVYPYEKTMVWRDFAMSSERERPTDVRIFSCLKYYPIAFLVAYDLSQYANLRSLHGFNRTSASEKKLIPIDFQPIHKHSFPEDSPSGFAYGSSVKDAIYSEPKAKKAEVVGDLCKRRLR